MGIQNCINLQRFGTSLDKIDVVIPPHARFLKYERVPISYSSPSHAQFHPSCPCRCLISGRHSGCTQWAKWLTEIWVSKWKSILHGQLWFTCRTDYFGISWAPELKWASQSNTLKIKSFVSLSRVKTKTLKQWATSQDNSYCSRITQQPFEDTDIWRQI